MNANKRELNTSFTNVDDKKYNNSLLDNTRNEFSLNIRDVIDKNNSVSISNYHGKTYLELDKSFFDAINVTDYSKYLIKVLQYYDLNKQIIDYIKLPDDLTKEQKRKIYNLIYNNFPMLGIDRLNKGDELLNINFFGIKELNERVGKDNVDLFINLLKKIIIGNFDKNFLNGRLIFNSYKNITFSYTGIGDVLDKLLSGFDGRIDLINYIFDNFVKDKNLLKHKEHFINFFYLGFGRSYIGKETTIENNYLFSYYDSYIGSKKISSSNSFIVNDYNQDDVFLNSEVIKGLEGIIIKTYKGKFIEIDGNNIPIVESIYGKYRINNKLLSFIRKGGDINELDEGGNVLGDLSHLVLLYINLLNENFDFISPENSFLDKLYTNLDEDLLNEGVINPLFITKNYKGYYNKSYFDEYTSNGEGYNIFIDVVDMGISNINDYEKIASDIVMGKIHLGELKSRLVGGGITGTTKIQEFARSIKIKNRDVFISVGGDEIFLFYDTSNFSYELLENIKKLTSKLGINVRISYGLNGEVGYNVLDEYTKITKFIRKKIDKILRKEITGDFEIYINPNLKDTVVNNLDYFIGVMEINLKNDKIINVLEGKKTKQIISSFKLLEREKNKNNIFDKGDYTNVVVSLSKNGKGYKIIIG